MAARPTIAVVGASVRATAFSLFRAGCDVVAADLFADADLVQLCPATCITEYPDGLADWLAKTECDGWLYTGALENHPDLIDHMAKLRPLLGMRGDVLRRVRDPLLLQDVLRTAGLNFPETKLCDGSHPGDGEWLHKTGQGGNGSGVSPFPSEPNSPTVGYWQRFIHGTPISALFIADGSRNSVLLGVTQQLIGEAWTGASAFQYCGTLMPGKLSMQATADITQIGQVLTTQFHLIGLFGVDAILEGDRVEVVEVNPRVTAAAEIAEQVGEVNLLECHLFAFEVAKVIQCEKSSVSAAGKVILYARQPLVISPSASQQLLGRTGSFDSLLLADIPNAGTKISLGEPILTVFSQGKTRENVEQHLRRHVQALENELYTENVGRHS